jgi:hypothetical protein
MIDEKGLEALAVEILAATQRGERFDEEVLRAYLDAIAEAMSALGITRAYVDFHGREGHGEVFMPPACEPRGGKVHPYLCRLIDAWIEARLPADWEEGDGSHGTVTIDPSGVPRVHVEMRRIQTTVTPGEVSADPDDEGLVELCAELASLGVATIEARYDGSGDEGWVEEVHFIPAPPADAEAEDLTERVEVWIAERLPPGWEINEGSFGSVRIDVATRRVDFDHHDRYEDETDASFDVD